MWACLWLGILLTAFGLYVVIKISLPKRWESAEGTVQKSSDGAFPTYCIKTDEGETGWTPYYKKRDETLSDGSHVRVFFYKKRDGKVVMALPEKDALITRKHGVVALCLGAVDLSWYIFWWVTAYAL